MTGLIVPAAEISSLAHAAGALVCFDGAQAAGQIPVDVAAIGSDFYVLNGHKWQLGPVGTGALYVRGAALEQLTPCASGGGSASGTSYPRGLDLTWKPDASKFEFGTRNWAVHAGWAEALDYLEQVGPGNARRHQLELGADLRRELGLVRGVTVIGPADPAWQTGLISFRLEGKDPQELCARLWEERHIATRPVGELGAVRASVAFFTAPEDVEALVRAVRDFAAAA
jgi:cysteine desulfurase/selenocysteine lyase